MYQLGKRTFVNAPGNDCKREDLYEKMIKVDPEGPTEEEHEEKCVTKHRYLSFRDQRSTTKGLCKALFIVIFMMTSSTQ